MRPEKGSGGGGRKAKSFSESMEKEQLRGGSLNMVGRCDSEGVRCGVRGVGGTERGKRGVSRVKIAFLGCCLFAFFSTRIGD